MTKSNRLALFGGTPVSKGLTAPPWPAPDEATADAIRDVYLSGKWSFGGENEVAFCRDFAAYHGAKHGVFMANGTATLECALVACGVGPGDEVIVPAMTWVATAAAAVYVGATPVFVDVEPTTLCIDPEQVAAAVTDRTRAIIPVHQYGSMADLEALLDIADRNDLALIEDCAHAHGGKWNGRGVGSWGKVGSFSFQQSKVMASGEGGICITNDDDLADKLYRLKHIGYGPASKQGQPSGPPPEGLICHNYRATEFQAVILRKQLEGLAQRATAYAAAVDRLTDRLDDAPGFRVQSPGRLAGPQSYYGVVILFDEEPLADIENGLIHKALNAEGLPTAWTYRTVYTDTLWNMPASGYRIFDGACSISEKVGTHRSLLLLHQWLGSDETTLDTIGDILAKVSANADALRDSVS